MVFIGARVVFIGARVVFKYTLSCLRLFVDSEGPEKFKKGDGTGRQDREEPTSGRQGPRETGQGDRGAGRQGDKGQGDKETRQGDRETGHGDKQKASRTKYWRGRNLCNRLRKSNRSLKTPLKPRNCL